MIDEYGALEYDTTTFAPVPLLEGDADRPLSEIPAFHPIKLNTEAVARSLQSVRAEMGTLFGRVSGWFRDLWFYEFAKHPICHAAHLSPTPRELNAAHSKLNQEF